VTDKARGGDLPARFAAEMGRLLGPEFPRDIALAVSGGGDSMAMLALAHGWARVMGVRLWAVTVDHGLRPESAREAAMVARECAALGHPHATLRWHWDGRGNLPDAARRARLALIGRWRRGIAHVLFAHTEDDVAETFVMRLARGSGVEGLSAMADRHVVMPDPTADAPVLGVGDVTRTETSPPPPRAGLSDGQAATGGFTVVRPLLGVSRRALRHHIDTLRMPCVDDPANADPRFDRARVRQAMPGLAASGVDRDALARTAARLARAGAALRARAADVAARIAADGPGGTGHLVFDRDALTGVERDTQMRLLAAALRWVAGHAYRPRANPLEALLDRALAGGGGTLHGARVRAERDGLRVFREYDAVKSLTAPAGPGAPWDGQWLYRGPGSRGLTIRALGPDGWGQVAEKPARTPPRDAMLSVPAVFDRDALVGCPALEFGPDHGVALRRPAASFAAFLESR